MTLHPMKWCDRLNLKGKITEKHADDIEEIVNKAITDALNAQRMKNKTLDQLINECVKLSETGDFHLERTQLSKETTGTWGASVDCFKDEHPIVGKTPIEAVERLLASLQEKV